VRGTHILICEKEEEGTWAREGEGKQLRKRVSSGPDLGSSGGQTRAILGSRERPNSGHIQQPSGGRF
jgi:hypothetical protein